MPKVAEQQAVFLLYDMDAAIQPIILVGNAIMQKLAHDPSIILGNFCRKQSVIRHITIRQIANSLKQSIGVQQKWRAEMLIVPLKPVAVF